MCTDSVVGGAGGAWALCCPPEAHKLQAVAPDKGTQIEKEIIKKINIALFFYYLWCTLLFSISSQYLENVHHNSSNNFTQYDLENNSVEWDQNWPLVARKPQRPSSPCFPGAGETFLNSPRSLPQEQVWRPLPPKCLCLLRPQIQATAGNLYWCGSLAVNSRQSMRIILQ